MPDNLSSDPCNSCKGRSRGACHSYREMRHHRPDCLKSEACWKVRRELLTSRLNVGPHLRLSSGMLILTEMNKPAKGKKRLMKFYKTTTTSQQWCQKPAMLRNRMACCVFPQCQKLLNNNNKLTSYTTTCVDKSFICLDLIICAKQMVVIYADMESFCLHIYTQSGAKCTLCKVGSLRARFCLLAIILYN